MGVPRLFPYIKDILLSLKSQRGLYLRFQEGEICKDFEYVYIDANGFLHPIAQMVGGYAAGKGNYLNPHKSLSLLEKYKVIWRIFFEKILDIIKMARPSVLLYISIDGPAPIAKQAQQRQRRFLSATSREPGEFDSNCMTPGTVFMNGLTRYVNYKIREVLNYGNFGNLKIVFSPSSDPGEGEHKIMNFIRNLPEITRSQQSHCIVGPDGDLMMLCMATYIPNMYLFREELVRFDRSNIGYWNILKIGTEFSGELSRRLRIPNVPDSINDFVFIGFFVGNDFLPKIKMFHLLEDGLNFMLDVYTSESMHLTTSGKINFKNLVRFIKILAEKEEAYLASQINSSQVPKEFFDETLSSSVINGKFNMELYISNHNAKIAKISGHNVRRACRDYIKTLVWIFEYYTKGIPSWTWAYKYHYPPLMRELLEYISSLKSFKTFETFSLDDPSPPFAQLLSVFPERSKNLIPKEYHGIYKSIPEMYPSDILIDYEGKTKEHEGVVLLPFVEYSNILEFYKKTTPKRIYIRDRLESGGIFERSHNSSETYTSEFGTISHSKIVKTSLDKLDYGTFGMFPSKASSSSSKDDDSRGHSRKRSTPDVAKLTKSNIKDFPYLKLVLPSSIEMLENLISTRPKITYDARFTKKTSSSSKGMPCINRDREKDFYKVDLVSNHYTEVQRMKCNVIGSKSPEDLWDSLSSTVKTRISGQYNEDVKLIHDELFLKYRMTMCNHFNVVLGKFIIEWLVGENARIIDPSAGWGDRLISSIASGAKEYFGVDPNVDLQYSYSQIIQDLGVEGCKYKVLPYKFEDPRVVIKKNSFDICLTSPPFFDKEIYTHTNEKRSYEKWLESMYYPYLVKLTSAVKKGGHIVLYVENFDWDHALKAYKIPLADDTKAYLENILHLTPDESTGFGLYVSANGKTPKYPRIAYHWVKS